MVKLIVGYIGQDLGLRLKTANCVKNAKTAKFTQIYLILPNFLTNLSDSPIWVKSHIYQ